MDNRINNGNKITSAMKKVSLFLSKVTLLTIYKKWSFLLRIFSVNMTKSLMENFIFCAGQQFINILRPKSGKADIIFGKPFNKSSKS